MPKGGRGGTCRRGKSVSAYRRGKSVSAYRRIGVSAYRRIGVSACRRRGMSAEGNVSAVGDGSRSLARPYSIAWLGHSAKQRRETSCFDKYADTPIRSSHADTPIRFRPRRHADTFPPTPTRSPSPDRTIPSPADRCRVEKRGSPGNSR
jgi:hypothetical protein